MIMPLVHIPHWLPILSMKACWTGCSLPFVCRPSMVRMSRPIASAASWRHDAIERDGACAALAGVAALLGARQAEILA
jgi:hypothetical protein